MRSLCWDEWCYIYPQVPSSTCTRLLAVNEKRKYTRSCKASRRRIVAAFALPLWPCDPIAASYSLALHTTIHGNKNSEVSAKGTTKTDWFGWSDDPTSGPNLLYLCNARFADGDSLLKLIHFPFYSLVLPLELFTLFLPILILLRVFRVLLTGEFALLR